MEELPNISEVYEFLSMFIKERLRYKITIEIFSWGKKKKKKGFILKSKVPHNLPMSVSGSLTDTFLVQKLDEYLSCMI